MREIHGKLPARLLGLFPSCSRLNKLILLPITGHGAAAVPDAENAANPRRW